MKAERPTLNQLILRLSQARLPATEFSGTVYRSTTPKFASESDLLTGEGSRRNGGRWNPIGIAVVYASLSPEVAMAETLAHYRYYGIPIEDSMPRTFVAIKTTLKVIDFRVGTIRQRIRVSLTRLLDIDWRKELREGREPLTHTIGRAAFEIGLEGIIVPSAADSNGTNLLIFPDNLRSVSQIQLLNPDQLAQ
jgi:RES domain-containing protein